MLAISYSHLPQSRSGARSGILAKTEPEYRGSDVQESEVQLGARNQGHLPQAGDCCAPCTCVLKTVQA